MKTRERFRDLFPELVGSLSHHPVGATNSILDVPGVKVGQVTVQDFGRGIHSGVTAVWPRTDAYDFRPFASGHVLHGAGEMTGLHQILEWGLIESPIVLTSTLNVGRVHDGVIQFLSDKNPGMGRTQDVVIPVVAECDDSFLSRAPERPVQAEHVREALEKALTAFSIEEGAVGAGTGMMAFDFKGGIGTSSRRVGEKFSLGVLVNANVGMRRQLRLGGRSFDLPEQDAQNTRPVTGERSIIVVVATDAPMRPDQLRRLSVRAGLGLARVGSFAGHGSGELVVSFTTSVGEPRLPVGKKQAERPTRSLELLHDSWLNPFYEAAVEAVEEAVLNALVAPAVASGAETAEFVGRDGHRAPYLPIAEIRRQLGQAPR